MLGRLILLLIQIAGGYIFTPMITGQIPVPGSLSLYLYAVAAAIVVFLIGLIGAQIIKDVGAPSSATLSFSLMLALIAAVLWSFGPEILPQVPWGKIPARSAVLGAAILGYVMKR